VVRGYSRYHKHTLGSRLRDGAIDIVLLTAGAPAAASPAWSAVLSTKAGAWP
jgi:hypothetical protein